MTVKELIEKLTELPQDKQVILHDTCLDLWVICSGVNSQFEFAKDSIALLGHEVPEAFIDWDEEADDEDEDW